MDEVTQLNAKIEKLETDFTEAQQRIATLQVVHEVARSLTSELNLEPLLHKILASAVEVMRAAAGSLLLLDELTDELEFAVVEGGGGDQLEGVRIPRDKGVAGWVATTRKPLVVNDVTTDDRYDQTIASSFDFEFASLLCVPMISRSRNKLIGVLQILRSTPDDYFEELDQQLLFTFGNQAAIAIENARLYESLKEERDHLIIVEDEIRKRLARDLHDGPAQLLASIVMSLNFTRQLLDRSPELAKDEIEQNINVADRALKQLRSLLFDLRPVILEAQGFIPALEMYVERLEQTEEFYVNLTVETELDRLIPNAEEAAFAIVQEAVSNARKYAEASRIDLRVWREEDQLFVSIKDDGIGFNVHEVTNRYEERGSLGLLNMQERAEAINGTLRIRSRPQSGTEITLSLPLSDNLLDTHEEK